MDRTTQRDTQKNQRQPRCHQVQQKLRIKLDFIPKTNAATHFTRRCKGHQLTPLSLEHTTSQVSKFRLMGNHHPYWFWNKNGTFQAPTVPCPPGGSLVTRLSPVFQIMDQPLAPVHVTNSVQQNLSYDKRVVQPVNKFPHVTKPEVSSPRL